MIRSLHLIDAVRIAALKGPDWAIGYAPANLGGQRFFSPPAFLWERVRRSRQRSAWASVEKGRISGLAAAGPCAGPTAWMVDHLVTPKGDDELCGNLLERAAAYAGRKGAETLFLRLPDEWHLVDIARHSGFLARAQVFVLTLPGRSPLLGVEPLQGLRSRTPADDHPLFRLYNATTPAEARGIMGMTLQQWKDAQEPRSRGTQELLLEQGDNIKAWVRLDHRQKLSRVRLIIHHEWQDEALPLVAFIVREVGPRTILWEVPEYQAGLRLLLERVGFETARSYRLMVKSLAVRVTKPSLAPAPTPG